jgi:predicted metal-dependent hydrolase
MTGSIHYIAEHAQHDYEERLMAPRRYALGAMREIDNELRKARTEEKEAAQRVKRLLAAQAALRGEPVPRKHQRRLARQDIRDYLQKHPGSLAVEIAEALGVPPTNIGTHLSNGKKDGEFDKHRNRWSLTQHQGGQPQHKETP